MVMISREEKRQVLTHLFKEGVMVVEKNVRKDKHDELDMWNHKVYMVCNSLKSKGYLKEVFNWQWHYYFIVRPSAEDAGAEDGLEYLREILGLPANVMPATHTKKMAVRSSGGAGDGERRGKGKGKGKGKGRKGGGWGSRDEAAPDAKPDQE